MSNWQYGTIVPTKYFRSANAIPRQLGLFKDGGEYYVSAYPVAELSSLEKESRTLSGVTATKLFDNTDGAYELDLELTVPAAGRSGFRLTNAAGDVVDLYFDSHLQRFVLDRTKSGIVDFGERSTTHEIENHDRRKTNSMDYVNDFALATWAPMAVKGVHRMKILYDITSLEVFIDGGRAVMTDLVFPNEPYDRLEAYSDKEGFIIEKLTITRLGL
jgi:fructan beta-fructosidase